MEVILLENVNNLGNLGEKVAVKSGYGRNFLIPKGKAIFASEENVKRFEERRAELEKAAADVLAAAQARADKLEGVSVTIKQNAGEEGKLFGSVGTQDIADALTAAGSEVSKSEVLLPHGAFREVGEYEVELQLHSDVAQTVKVIIEAE